MLNKLLLILNKDKTYKMIKFLALVQERSYSLPVYVLSLSLYISGTLVPQLAPYAMFVGFFTLLNVADYIGYEYNLRAEVDIKEYQTQAYRVLMHIFKLVLFALIYMTTHRYDIIVLTIFVHLSGLQDLLYYLMGKFKMPGVWSWMQWSYIGWFKGNNVTDRDMYIQTTISMLLAIAYLVLI